ncbi:MAG: hypothetical protein R2726_06185 [Acidimicrobiales bacterium]
MPSEVTRLPAFPRHRLLGQELFACPANEVDLLTVLGEPTAEYQPSLGEGTPILFWDLEWSCGLVMGLQFDQLAQRLSGFLDQPEVAHALRHLQLDPPELWILERDEPTRFRQVCPEPPLRTAHLWRVVPDDDDVDVADGLTPRDAECLAGELAADTGEGYEVREGPPPAHQPAAPPPSEPPRINEPVDLFDEMVIDIGDDDELVLGVTEGGAADHVRRALIRRAAQATGREPADPAPDVVDPPVIDTSGKPLRRRDLFSMPRKR